MSFDLQKVTAIERIAKALEKGNELAERGLMMQEAHMQLSARMAAQNDATNAALSAALVEAQR